MIEVTTDEVVQAFQRDWPAQYEITALRLINAKQAVLLEQLQRPAPAPEPEAEGS